MHTNSAAGEVKTSRKTHNHDMTEKQNAAETPRLSHSRKCLPMGGGRGAADKEVRTQPCCVPGPKCSRFEAKFTMERGCAHGITLRECDFHGRRRQGEGQEWQGLGGVEADGRFGDQAFQRMVPPEESVRDGVGLTRKIVTKVPSEVRDLEKEAARCRNAEEGKL